MPTPLEESPLYFLGDPSQTWNSPVSCAGSCCCFPKPVQGIQQLSRSARGECASQCLWDGIHFKPWDSRLYTIMGRTATFAMRFCPDMRLSTIIHDYAVNPRPGTPSILELNHLVPQCPRIWLRLIMDQIPLVI